MDNTETTNLNYREYIYWLKSNMGQDSKELKSALLHTSVWSDPAVKKNYNKHAAYNNYPVVGVSYEQAVAYCKWRSDRLNETMARTRNKKYSKIICRLPTKEEWEKVASQEGVQAQLESKGAFTLLDVQEDGTVKGHDITAPVESLQKSKMGYYNLIGNVAEMVQEKGVAKGGSWQQADYEVSVKKDFAYNAPTNWIGFRCVLEKK